MACLPHPSPAPPQRRTDQSACRAITAGKGPLLALDRSLRHPTADLGALIGFLLFASHLQTLERTGGQVQHAPTDGTLWNSYEAVVHASHRQLRTPSLFPASSLGLPRRQAHSPRWLCRRPLHAAYWPIIYSAFLGYRNGLHSTPYRRHWAACHDLMLGVSACTILWLSFFTQITIITIRCRASIVSFFPALHSSRRRISVVIHTAFCIGALAWVLLVVSRRTKKSRLLGGILP